MRDVYFRSKDKWSQPTRNWLHFTERTICAIKSNSDLLHLNYTRLHQLSWRINKKSVALLFTISHEMTRRIVQSHEKKIVMLIFFFQCFVKILAKLEYVYLGATSSRKQYYSPLTQFIQQFRYSSLFALSVFKHGLYWMRPKSREEQFSLLEDKSIEFCGYQLRRLVNHAN